MIFCMPGIHDPLREKIFKYQRQKKMSSTRGYLEEKNKDIGIMAGYIKSSDEIP